MMGVGRERDEKRREVGYMPRKGAGEVGTGRPSRTLNTRPRATAFVLRTRAVGWVMEVLS